jgi:cell division control protein 6
MKRLLRADQTLFRDPDVFDFAYIPDHHDAQIQELAFLLQGAGPRNAVLRGPPGTGKTTTVRRVFSELTGEFIPVYVNCRQNHTLLAVYRCIAKDLLGYASPSRHLDDTREAIAARLGEKDARLLVCLDDANYLITHTLRRGRHHPSKD